MDTIVHGTVTTVNTVRAGHSGLAREMTRRNGANMWLLHR